MGTTSESSKGKLYKTIEQVAVVVGAVICLAVVSLFAMQEGYLWPLPGIYFFEIGVLALLAAASRLIKITAESGGWNAMPWIAAGVLFPFVILGGFSIGPYLFPAMLAFLLAGIITDRRTRQGMGNHAGQAVMVALVQGFIIVALSMLNSPQP